MLSTQQNKNIIKFITKRFFFSFNTCIYNVNNKNLLNRPNLSKLINNKGILSQLSANRSKFMFDDK